MEKIQPISPEKRKTGNKTTLAGNKENIIFEDHLVSEERNNFFGYATKRLQTNKNSCINNIDSNETNLVENFSRNYPISTN